MRIAIACHPTQGGSGIVATELAIALAAKGHDMHMVSCNRPYRLTERHAISFHQVYVPEYPLFKYPPHDLSVVNKLVQVSLEHDIDIIHAHYAVPHAICAILAQHVAKPKNVKVVATMHGTDITLVGSHPEFADICRYTMQHADALTVVSEWGKQRTRDSFKLKRDPVVIHNFVDTSKFTPKGRIGYPGKGESFVLVHASNFRPVKRVADIIRVFFEVQKELPARLKLVGKGPELGIARELCAELGICDKVEFCGSVFDIARVFRNSHLFLLLSDYESFGLSALEAMACGAPAAASRAGGLPEVIQDNGSGLLNPVGANYEAAQRIIRLLRQPDKWRAMSQQAAQAARERFSIAQVIPRYERLYHQVLEENR